MLQEHHAMGGMLHALFWIPEPSAGITGSIRPGRSPLYYGCCPDATLSLLMITVKIKVSKTDPFRQGMTVHLGRTGAELCPVAALLSGAGATGRTPIPLRRRDTALETRPSKGGTASVKSRRGSPATAAQQPRQQRLAWRASSSKLWGDGAARCVSSRSVYRGVT